MVSSNSHSRPFSTFLKYFSNHCKLQNPSFQPPLHKCNLPISSNPPFLSSRPEQHRPGAPQIGQNHHQGAEHGLPHLPATLSTPRLPRLGQRRLPGLSNMGHCPGLLQHHFRFVSQSPITTPFSLLLTNPPSPFQAPSPRTLS